MISRIFPLGFKKDCLVLCKTALPIVIIFYRFYRINNFIYTELIRKVLTSLINVFILLQSVIFSGHQGKKELGAVSIGNLVRKILISQKF